MSDSMTGKEVINLISILKEKGMSSDEIIEVIDYIERTTPTTNPEKIIST